MLGTVGGDPWPPPLFGQAQAPATSRAATRTPTYDCLFITVSQDDRDGAYADAAAAIANAPTAATTAAGRGVRAIGWADVVGVFMVVPPRSDAGDARDAIGRPHRGCPAVGSRAIPYSAGDREGSP